MSTTDPTIPMAGIPTMGTPAPTYDGFDYDGFDYEPDEEELDYELDEEFDEEEFDEEEEFEEEFGGVPVWTPARPPVERVGPDPGGPLEVEPVEVIGHVSDLLAGGHRLRRSDTAPLRDLVGRQATKAVTGRLEQDWSQARGQRPWWRRFGRLAPLPDSLAELVARWQDGEQLRRADQDLLADVVGRDLARRLLPDVRRGWWR